MKYTTIAAAAFCATTQAYQLNQAEAEIVGVPINELTTVQYNTIIAGIAYGFVDKEGLTLIETCIADAKPEAVLAFEALGYLKHGDFATGLTEVAEIVKALPPLLTACKAIGPDIVTLEEYIANLAAQPDIEAYIRKDITRHILALTKDLALAKTYYSNANYWEFGMELGTMLAVATQ